MSIQLATLLFTAIAGLSAAVAAWIMYHQTKLSIQWQKEQAKADEELRKREYKLQEVNSKIRIASMWNDFNRAVFNGDEETRRIIGERNFENLSPEMVRRVYIMFSTINVIEVAWLLNRASAIDPDQAYSLIDDQCEILRRDKEAAKLALQGRGYTEGFVYEVWKHAWPEDVGEQETT